MKVAALAAAAAASDAGFASVAAVSGRLAREALTRQERHALERSLARVRSATKRGELPDPRHVQVLQDFGVDWRQALGTRGEQSLQAGRASTVPNEDLLEPGASRFRQALASHQMQRQARSLGMRERSTTKRVLEAAETHAKRALQDLDPAAAAEANRIEAALHRHAGLI